MTLSITKLGKNRNTWIEILRIVSMLLIFYHHCLMHGGMSWWSTYDVQDFFREAFYRVGKLGVIIYVLISGYVLVDSKFSWKRVIGFVIEIYLFSFAFFIVKQINEPMKITWESMRPYLMPFSFNQYWFASVYLLLYLASPIINLGVNTYGKKMLVPGIIILFALVSFIPSVYRPNTYVNGILIFVLLYFIGAFIKRYPLKDLKWFKILFLIAALAIYSLVIIAAMNYAKAGKTNIFYHIGNILNNDNSPVSIVVGTLIVLFFTQLKPFSCRWVNILLSCSFEIYLIHDNPYVRTFIYKTVYNTKELPHTNTWTLQFMGINFIKFLVVFAIALACKVVYQFLVVDPINLISNQITRKQK